MDGQPLPIRSARAPVTERWRTVVGIVVLSGLMLGAVLGWTVLSSVLLVGPFMAVAVMPASVFAGAARCWVGGLVLLIAAALPTIVGLPLGARYHAWPVWWAALLHGWCALGIAAVVLGLAARCWPPGSGMLRLALSSVVLMGGMSSAMPLVGLYVPHLTSDDAPPVITLSERRDLTITLRDGTALDARFYRPRNGVMKGVAVFTHGVGGWKEAWLNHLRLFLEADWAVLAYDLRGHGRSSPGAVTYGWREADDLVEVWQVARGLGGGRPQVAYGVSLGTGITALAAERLEGCRALILESPFADFSAMAERRLPALLRVPALVVARFGVGMDVAAMRPLAVHPAADVRRLVGWVAEDRVVPAGQSAALATALGAQTLVQEHGEHLDLIMHEPWRELVRRTLAEITP